MLDHGFYNMDCMQGMGQFPDNYFDLAIVDPPYGIGAGGENFKNGTSKTIKPYYKKTDWDTMPPDCQYFTELKRVSKNQIIWGGNYFISHLESSRCFIVWDKTIHGNSYADCEFAWTSFDRVARIFVRNIAEVNKDGRIHPTQKPVLLYRWILKEYGQAGWKILDTHVGSGSSLIACEREGFQYAGFEIDPDYYKAAKERIERERQQLTLGLH